MDQVAVNRAFFVGLDRSCDVMALLPSGDESEAEIVGMFVACVNELSDRWKLDAKKTIQKVMHVFPNE